MKQNPPRVTKAEGEGYLEPAAGQDRGPGAVAVTATSDQSVAPWHPGEEERSSPGTRRVASMESSPWAAAPGVPRGLPKEG